MRSLSLLFGLAALVACGCGKSGSNPAAPTSDRRGTPLGPAGAFASTNTLLWSSATNEIVGNGGRFSSGLIALHALVGTTRTLDDHFAFLPVAPVSVTRVYYQVFLAGSAGDDSLDFRSIDLAAGGPVSIGGCTGTCLFTYAVSGDGAWLVWALARFDGGRFQADSMVIEHTLSGTSLRVEPGVPLLMSLDGSRFLYRAAVADFAVMVFDRDARTSAPLDFRLPAGIIASGLRWDAAGLHALYLPNPHELWVRHVETGASEPLYATADSLLDHSLAWSPDGRHVALWSLLDPQGAQPSTQSLHVVDIMSKRGRVLATGNTETIPGQPLVILPGAITFSPDSRRVAYGWGDRLFSAMVPGALAANGSPGSGFGSGPVTVAGGSVLGRDAAALRRATPATPAR